MFGMDKSKLRLKAMDKMMKEKPEISIAIEKGEMGEEEMGMDGMKEGYISMPVSPEEKAMILKMRKMGGMEEESEEEVYA